MSDLELSQPPVFRRVRNWIVESVRSGKWKPGDRLPSVQELADMLGVSRGSVREALRVLEREGFVTIRQGVGTFIRKSIGKVTDGLERIRTLFDIIGDSGRKVTTRDSTVVFEAMDEDLAEKLGRKPGDPAVVIDRVYLADDVPVAYCVTYLPMDVIGTDVNIKPDEPLLEYLEKAKGKRVAFGDCKIMATNAGSHVGAKLQVPEDYSVLLLEQTMYDAEGRILLHTKDFFNSAEIDFHVRRVSYRDT